METSEKFTLIMNKQRSPTTGYVKKATYSLCGYGENDMGPFTIEGQVNLVTQDKIFEKDGLKNFKKMKVGKFELTKKYQKRVIEELAEEAVASRMVPIEEPEDDFEMDEEDIQDPDFVKAMQLAKIVK